MRLLGVSLAATVAVSLSCGGSQPSSSALSSAWKPPAILAHIPANTPYVFAALEPISDQLRQRMMTGFEHSAREVFRKLDELRGSTSETAPWLRAALAVASELRGKDPTSWAKLYGFDPSGQFALYGLSLWPVLRIAVTDPIKLRGAIERVSAAAGTRLTATTRDGRAYWTSELGDFTLIAAVLDREAVVALLPTRAVEGSLPLVLGTTLPTPSLAATTKVPELMGRHRLLGYLLAYFDARSALDIVTSTAPSALDAPIHALTGPISPGCQADLGRLVDLAPRLVSGYRKLDDAGFAGVMVAEAPAGVTGPLAKLRTPVSGVTSDLTGHALFALGAAARPEAVVAWLGGVAKQIRDRPFTCKQLAGINEAGTELADAITKPLPAPFRGLRGFSLVIDDATVLPPSVDGHVLVAGDVVADFLSTLAGSIPAIAGIPIKRDGRPVPLPLAQLGVPLDSGHIAMTSDRLVVTAGTSSAARATTQLAAPVPASSPLFTMAFDTPRLRKLLAAVGKSDLDGLASLGAFAMSVDVTSDGIVFDFAGTWAAESKTAAPPAQP
jgi:hypothetical protein